MQSLFERKFDNLHVKVVSDTNTVDDDDDNVPLMFILRSLQLFYNLFNLTTNAGNLSEFILNKKFYKFL
ncbi:hypothetical protein BLA29_002596 [Euroglyphus maynei]|uniref:Uncharacterized protein n=1 Tax=Euroglyphus maynei TaxID=6958 RepID=A0A1Y3AW08_EURMA|nr:hypothetical protein BLA29_002596 [Euroglyphus maynei]